MSGQWDDGVDHQAEDDRSETLPCPACGAEIYEDAEQCPACGQYVVRQTRVLFGKGGCYALLAVAGIVAVVLVLSGLIKLL